jgi:transcriptional regulator with XRE-family HTH domain
MRNKRPVTLGDRVYQARKLKKMTQLELARKADVTPEVISRLETGRSRGAMTSLSKIAKALDTTVDRLLDLSKKTGAA